MKHGYLIDMGAVVINDLINIKPAVKVKGRNKEINIILNGCLTDGHRYLQLFQIVQYILQTVH